MVGILDIALPLIGLAGGAALGGNGGSDTSTVTTQQQIPQFILDAQQNLIGQAQQVAAEPYYPFPGPQVAGFTPDQLSAFEQIRNFVPGGIADLDTARSLLQGAAQGGSPFEGGIPPELGEFLSLRDSDTLQEFQSPYMEQVIERAIAEIDRQGNIARTQLESRAANAGAFGGGRFGVESAGLESGLQRERANTIANLYQSGFQNAQQALNQERDARLARFQANLERFGVGSQQDFLNRSYQLSGGTGIANLATARNALEWQPIQALLGIGGQQQGLGQTNLDVLKQNFQAQQAYPANQLNFLSGIISGQRYPTTTTQTTTTPTAGTLQQLAGLGIAGLGALGSADKNSVLAQLLNLTG